MPPAQTHPDLAHPGVFAPEALLPLVRGWQRAGLRVVFTNGCYDLVHAGHVDLLARARALGDRLVLALNTDASVRRLGKGADRPIQPLAARAFVAAHLAAVDAVTWFDEDTPLALITRMQPDVLVKGGDWPVERIVGAEVVIARGGSVHSLPLLPGFSTTGLLRAIRASAPQAPQQSVPARLSSQASYCGKTAEGAPSMTMPPSPSQ